MPTSTVLWKYLVMKIIPPKHWSAREAPLTQDFMKSIQLSHVIKQEA